MTRFGSIFPTERANAIRDAEIGGMFVDFPQLIFSDDIVLPAFKIVEHERGNQVSTCLDEMVTSFYQRFFAGFGVG